MYRYSINQLIKWKNNKNRKPLIIEGARQVGKTWLMKEFGKNYYKECIYINFDSNENVKQLFEPDYDTNRIIKGLEIYFNIEINPETTLIIFDEIQEMPRALSSLKYFAEDAPRYNIVCAGSLLGIAIHNNTSFPVGKVDFIKLYPLSFEEFLLAAGKEKYVETIKNQEYDLLSGIKNILIKDLRDYYFVGGMPEAVNCFAETEDYNEVRKIQQNILKAYENDFSKHAPATIVPKIRMVWNSISAQLAKENKKFVYGLLKEGGRAKEFEIAIMWLVDSGLVHKISRINKPALPLKAYEDLKAYKLFMLDVGLLGCMSGLAKESLINNDKELFEEFKGALTENYVCTQLKLNENIGVYYYTNDRGSCEVDFVIDTGNDVIPIEVKADINLKAKSLRTYNEKFNPKKCLRFSMSDYKEQDWVTNIPLYCLNDGEMF